MAAPARSGIPLERQGRASSSRCWRRSKRAASGAASPRSASAAARPPRSRSSGPPELGKAMENLAWALSGGFGIDKLGLEERPCREPGHGEARVRIEWISLNRRDLLLVEGVYNPRQKLPIVPCSDGAGVIEATGAGCYRVEVGDSVVIHFFPGWIAGAPEMIKLATALGGGPGGDGVLQQTIVTSEQALVRLPTGISTEFGSTLPCAALTAWSAVVVHGGVGPGSVVVTQGTGGVSLFALQFAKMLGARVVATTSTEAKAAKLAELGADAIVNYRNEPDWGRRVRELAGGAVDLIVEVGGAETLDASLRLIRPGGTIALIGVLSGAKAAINLPLAVMRQVRLQGVTCGHRENFEQMLRAIAAHGIDPVISHRFGLTEAREAFACMAANDHVGKIVIAMAG